ncbi:MAG: hypothetical protein R2739_09655 [Chitinophagales bacterium]
MKSIFALLFFILPFISKAQLAPEDFQKLKLYEDTIRSYGDTLINSQLQENRSIASYRIIQALTRALKIKNSFYYNWSDSLPWKITIPEDGSFKIFTWYVRNDEDLYRFFGTIQMKSDTLKLFPLIDYSDFTDHQQDINVDNNNWIGALYYGIKTVKNKKKTYYTLFGWDGNNAASNKKVMEILSFNKAGQPRFGAPIIDMGKGKILNRFIIEYAESASISLNFNALQNKVMFDHVAPSGDVLEGFFANYVPDGTYEGFEWKKGKWHYIESIAYEKREDGDVPNVGKKETFELYKPKGK